MFVLPVQYINLILLDTHVPDSIFLIRIAISRSTSIVVFSSSPTLRPITTPTIELCLNISCLKLLFRSWFAHSWYFGPRPWIRSRQSFSTVHINQEPIAHSTAFRSKCFAPAGKQPTGQSFECYCVYSAQEVKGEDGADVERCRRMIA